MILKELLAIHEENDVSAEMVDDVFGRLVNNARTENNFNSQEEKMLKSDIKRKLKQGWTDSEVVKHMKWLEYFDDVTDEDKALANLKSTKDAVEARLASQKK